MTGKDQKDMPGAKSPEASQAKINAKDRLILALDVPSVVEAERLLDRVGDGVSFVKVGLELFTAVGPEIVETIQSRHKRVFLDLKYLDIEETVKRATAQAAELGVEFLTIHANRKALRGAIEGRKAGALTSNLKILAVTVLTNFDTNDLHEMGIQMTARELVIARAKLAAELGVEGVVASGEEPALIRKEVGQQLIIVTPGIRPLDQHTHDHARVTTPTQAIRAGSDYLVVGRPIRDATDPRAAAEAIVAEMQKAFDGRP